MPDAAVLVSVNVAADWTKFTPLVPHAARLFEAPAEKITGPPAVKVREVLLNVRLALSCNVPGPLSNMIAFAVPPVVVVVPTVSVPPPPETVVHVGAEPLPLVVKT